MGFLTRSRTKPAEGQISRALMLLEFIHEQTGKTPDPQMLDVINLVITTHSARTDPEALVDYTIEEDKRNWQQSGALTRKISQQTPLAKALVLGRACIAEGMALDNAEIHAIERAATTGKIHQTTPAIIREQAAQENTLSFLG